MDLEEHLRVQEAAGEQKMKWEPETDDRYPPESKVHKTCPRTRHLGGGAVVSICSCQDNLCNLLLSSASVLNPSIIIMIANVLRLFL